ncbi:MAG: recombination-associated protein RdgC, partial [Enterobacterales bacterium]|nr:recombination-associated protein RdgC [Enterobacterales bacterium]
MIFKSARIYRLTTPLTISAEELEKQLAEYAFTPCESFQLSSFGWIEPLGKHGKLLAHHANGRIMFTACKEERLLPAGVIRDVVEQEVELIETEQARRVFATEKRRIKEDVISRLLPQAFAKRRKIYGYLDTRSNLLVVESTTLKVAEEFIQLLRKTLGTLPVIPLITQQ